jgi:mono/diheme cytochrome c family protein
MLAEQDPIAIGLLQKYNNLPMPNLRLTDGDVASVIAYLEAPDGAAAPTTGGAAPVSLGGDPNIGKNLFTGVKRLENHGPSCRTCHTATGIGADAGPLGRGALGPDLTGVYGRLGDSTIGMPLTGTMAPIFSEKPLTPDEQANLLAFFKAAGATKRPSQTIFQLIGIAVGGLVVVAGLSQIVWRRRLRNVRETMVAGQASRRT